MSSYITINDYLDLPLFFTGIENEIESNSTSISEEQRLKQSKLKILVVEDELINQLVARDRLEMMGYEVIIAETGEQALTFFQESQYALVLMDMGLPDKPGTEVTKAMIQWEQPQGKVHTPIIAHTANGNESRPACKAAGMDDFAPKPMEFEAFKTLLHQYID